MFQISRTPGLSDLISGGTSFALEDSGESSTNMLYLYGTLPLLPNGLYESILELIQNFQDPEAV